MYEFRLWPRKVGSLDCDEAVEEISWGSIGGEQWGIGVTAQLSSIYTLRGTNQRR